jgi:hypothetical protein
MIAWISALVGILVGVAGLVFKLYQWRAGRIEKAAKKQAEVEEREIQRRAPSTRPFYRLSDARFQTLELATEKPWEYSAITMRDRALLCAGRNEIDGNLPPGEIIYLLVENKGCDPSDLTVIMEGEPVSLVTFNRNPSRPLFAFAYPFDPVKFRRHQTVQIYFLAADGTKDSQAYATIHGIRTLKRVDPA